MQNQDGMMWHGGEASCAVMPKDAPSRSGHGRCWELPLNLLKMSSARVRFPAEKETHAQA